MSDFLSELFIKYLLPTAATVLVFFGFGVKKYIEKTAELMAEGKYNKIKEK